MANEWVGVAAFLALLVILLLRVPIAVALLLVGLAGYATLDGWNLALITLGTIPFELARGYSLSVVPLFVLMGAIASWTGMSKELYAAANALFRSGRAPLANATIGACAMFGSICGSSLATTATMSRVSVPEMRRHGYDLRLATGAVASGATLGILIPPSVILVLYAIIAEASIAHLFAAALIPGIIMALLHIVVIEVWVRVNPEIGNATTARTGERRRLTAVLKMWKMVLLFLLAVGGIYLGWFSPTEAAAVGAFAAIVIGFGTRTLSLQGFWKAICETILTTAMLFFVLLGALMFARFIALTQLPFTLTEFISGLGLPVLVVLFAIVLVYIILGCFLETVSMLLITVPVFLPLVTALGFDPIWFGVLVVVVAEVGLITPPVGMNIFVIKSQFSDIPLTTIFKGVGPFLVADAALILLLLFVPVTATWLPQFLYS